MTYWHHKAVLITGGSAGLGLAIAKAFVSAGANVIVAGRGAEQLRAAVLTLQEHGEADGVVADVTDQAQVDAAIAATLERFGQLDVLVNNVGLSMRGEVVHTPVKDFQRLWETNFLTVVRCTRAAVPHLLKTRGHIVNIGSLASKTASPLLGAYPATKFPVAAYSQQLRFELGPHGIHTLLVCPGPIARDDAGSRYDAQAANLPEAARRPGGGAKIKGIRPEVLAEKIVAACRKRRAELVVPRRAKLLFAISQLAPCWGDWIVNKMTSS